MTDALNPWVRQRSSSDDDELDPDAFWLCIVERDYERARRMGLVEPTWLPEGTLQEYAEYHGIKRHPKTDPEHVRARIRNFRRDRRMTQLDLARQTGLSQSAISRFEVGRRAMRLHHLTKLAQALDVPVEALVRTPREDGD